MHLLLDLLATVTLFLTRDLKACSLFFSVKWMQQFANRSLAWGRHFFHSRSFASVFKCQGFKMGCIQSTEVTICHLYWMHLWYVYKRWVVSNFYLTTSYTRHIHNQWCQDLLSWMAKTTDSVFPYLKSFKIWWGEKSQCSINP